MRLDTDGIEVFENETPTNLTAHRLIREHISNHGMITVDEGVELVRNIYVFDYKAAKKKALANFVRNKLVSIRDIDGVRSVFATKDDHGNRMYINVDTCNDPILVRNVINQLDIKYTGLGKSKRKCQHHMRVLNGQISMEI